MVLDRTTAKRLLIYFIYDRDGIVDDYIFYMLDDLEKNVEDIFVVVNGTLEEKSKERLKFYTDQILERENIGFDVWAYKEAMETVGWQKLRTYDEVILMNYTIMGPIYPLKDMFDTMAERDLDFWGVTKFHQVDMDPFGTVPYGYLPDHIQTHFLVFRQSLLESGELKHYWDTMPMIESYQDSVGRHEASFTKRFADFGFKWDVYVDSEEYRSLTYQPIIGMAKQMIAEKKCPFFKRRSFMQNYATVLHETCGQEGYDLLDYLTNHTDYDMNLFWDNILRLENQADIKKNMQANYVLPYKESYVAESTKQLKTALVMHMYFPDLVEECYHYAQSMPDNADIYITTNSEEKKQNILKIFRNLTCNKLDVRVVPNCGRDVGPFLVEFKDHLMDYDLICHTHDKKVGQLKPGSIGASFSYRCFENVLKSKQFVENIMQTFAENERLGILMPPPPNHGPYYITLGLEWGMNFGVTKELADTLGIHVNMNEKKEPIAPLGSVFWARPKAIKKIFDHNWTYEEFPKEPIADDGTVLHAVERIYSFAAQDAGFYPGWVFSELGAAMEITNLNQMLRSLNEEIFFKGQAAGKQEDVLLYLDKRFSMLDRFFENTNYSEASLYLRRKDGEFNQNDIIKKQMEWTDGSYRLNFENLESYGPLRGLRFDPTEAKGVELTFIRITVLTEDGRNLVFDLNHLQYNGIRVEDHLAYLGRDPQVMVDLEEPLLLKKVLVEMEIEYEVREETIEKIQGAYHQ